jgi:predicted enzyme related to lactoylglutathione lyase
MRTLPAPLPLAVSDIGGIAIRVSDGAQATVFYRDVLGLKFLFPAGPNLAFLAAGAVRLMLTTPQGSGAVGENAILYFKVKDVVAMHAAMVARGAANERALQLAVKMPDHELWIGFVRDPDGNLVGLMEEKRWRGKLGPKAAGPEQGAVRPPSAG